MSNKYVVYAAFDDVGNCLYVGEGVSGRESHITSGTSHVYEANKWHFENKPIRVEILHSSDSKEEVSHLEQLEIFNRTPLWNKVVKSTTERLKLKNYIEINVGKILGFSLSKVLKLDSHPKFKTALAIKHIAGKLNAFGVADISNKELGEIYTHRRLLNQIETGHSGRMAKLFTAEHTGLGVYRVTLIGWNNEE